MAYAALVSLAQTIQHIILLDDKYSAFLVYKQQIRSLHELLILLNDSLRNNQLGSLKSTLILYEPYDKYTLGEVRKSLRRIIDRANAAEYIMKRIIAEDYGSYYILKPFLSYSVASMDKDLPQLFQQLQKVTEAVCRLAKDAAKIEKCIRTRDVQWKKESFPTLTTILSMVDFDDLPAIEARLKSRSSNSSSENLGQILQCEHQSSDIFHERQQIRSLHADIVFFQAFLDDFPEIANNLEGRIRDIAYETEDIIEHFMSEKSRLYSILNLNFERYPHDFKQLCQDLQRVREEIATIAREVIQMKNNHTTGDVQLISETSNASSPSTIVRPPTGKDIMVGFENNLLAIKDRLSGGLSGLQVIPIFGMGGIGKTTLAIKAYDDPLTREHFEIRAWVTISQNYNVKEIISCLLVVLKPYIGESTTKNESVVVFQSLKGRRYLIVLDDMWSTKVWDDIRRLFPDENNGSRVMLTTRLSDVAAYPTDSSSPLHEMHLMDVDQSWKMLRQKVFKQECCPPELENIGRMIASSCQGLPLAIVVIAGILSTINPTESSWKKVSKDVTSAVTTNDEQFSKILSLSYIHLPHHLRPCFLYMGGFPEDYKIQVSKLIKLWVAEGFLRPSDSLSDEEVANECLEDLVKRSLVLVTNRNSNGKIKSCSIHDLLRDLCIREAQEEKFLFNAKKILAESVKKERRVSIYRSRRSSVPYIHGAIYRTILCFPPWHDMLSSLKDFRLLRVLDVVRLTFSVFPAEVLELFLLRYLAFSISRDVVSFEVPSSISHLQSLQTLFIFSSKTKIGHVKCHCQIHLYFSIWEMTKLRHLFLLRVNPLPNGNATHFLTLQNLQTLAIIMDFKCSKMIVQGIPNLRKLKIVYQKDRIRWLDFELDNLVHLQRLEKLNIDVEKHRMDPVPFWEKLAFPKMLKKLKLRGFRFSLQDMGVIGLLPNLQVLKLRDCSYEDGKWETTEEEFPKLKILQIISTDLEHWKTESGHYPCLERLMLCHCGNLGEIPDVIREIPTLELIEVCIQDKPLVDSAHQIRKDQQNDGNDSLQVRVINYYYDD